MNESLFNVREELIEESPFLSKLPHPPTEEELNDLLPLPVIKFYREMILLHFDITLNTSNDFWNYIEIFAHLHFLMLHTWSDFFTLKLKQYHPDYIRDTFIVDPRRFDKYNPTMLDEVMVYKRELIPEHLQIKHYIGTYDGKEIYDVKEVVNVDLYYKFNINDIRTGNVEVYKKFASTPRYSKQIARSILVHDPFLNMQSCVYLPSQLYENIEVHRLINRAIRNCDIDKLFKWRNCIFYGPFVPNIKLCENEKFVEMIKQGIDFPIVSWAVLCVMIKLGYSIRDIYAYEICHKKLLYNDHIQYVGVSQKTHYTINLYLQARIINWFAEQYGICGIAADQPETKFGDACFGKKINVDEITPSDVFEEKKYRMHSTTIIRDINKRACIYQTIITQPEYLINFPDMIYWPIVFANIGYGDNDYVSIVHYHNKQNELLAFLLRKDWWGEYLPQLQKFNEKTHLFDGLEHALPTRLKASKFQQELNYFYRKRIFA